jgi:Mn2+/Fe2+ NRAMP family transporter
VEDKEKMISYAFDYWFVLLVIVILATVWFDKFLRSYRKDSALENQSTNVPMEKAESDSREEATADAINDCQNTEYPYWSSLLTFNAIFIAVFTYIISQNNSNKALVFVIVIGIFICVLSSALIVITFFSKMLVLRQRAKVFSPYLNLPAKDRKTKAEEHGTLENNERTARERNERWTFILLTLQCSIIVAFLYLVIQRFS